MNSVQLVGKLTRHPTTKFEGEGQQTCSFTVAITEPSREGKPFTLYVGCTSWGRSAETCSLLNAEDLVAAQGKLTWQKRTGKCGTEHSVLVVSVKECTVLDPAAVEVPA